MPRVAQEEPESVGTSEAEVIPPSKIVAQRR